MSEAQKEAKRLYPDWKSKDSKLSSQAKDIYNNIASKERAAFIKGYEFREQKEADKLSELQAKYDLLNESSIAMSADYTRFVMEHNILKKQREWVDVKDRLPEKNGLYLVWDNEDNAVHKMSYNNGVWRSNGCVNCTEYISHWQPLPSPPNKG